MIRQKLKERQDRINRKEFPLKCEQHNIKIIYDKKIKECKSEIKSTKNKIINEYKKTVLTKDYLNEYVFRLISLFFNENNHPNEKEIIKKSYNIIDALEEFQEEKKKIFLNEKEILEGKALGLFEKEDQNEKELINNGFKRICLSIEFFNKLKDEFIQKNSKLENISYISEKFDKLYYQNRNLQWDLNLIKIVNAKIIKMYNKELEKNKSLLKEYNNYIRIKKRNREKKKEILKLEESSEENKTSKLFTTRVIYSGNYYDIFNCDYYKSNSNKKNLHLNIKNTNYSTVNSINIDKKCLSQENIKRKIINKKDLKLSNHLSHNKINKIKKNLTIKTDIVFNIHKLKSINNKLKRVFSAKTLTNTNKNHKSNFNKNESLYLRKVIEYIKIKIEEKNKYINKMRLLISDELKSLIWVKNFIGNLINELRNDIDDIKYYITSDKSNINLKQQLKYNEKLLFFCIYFYDNCMKGSKKTNYFFKENNKNIECLNNKPD